MSEETSHSLRARVRPLTMGLSIGTRYGSAGCTLGAFVKDRDGQVGFLTSASALGVQEPKSDDVVYQPSALDAGTLAFRDIVGHVKDFTVLNTSEANYVDAALVALSEGIEAAGNNIPTLTGFELSDQALNHLVPAIGVLGPATRVAKIGRTTGYTEGAITAQLSSLKVSYNGNDCRFEDVIEITSPIDKPFSKSGDAGAVVFTVPERQPLGVLFAAGKTSHHFVAFACRLDRILELFNVELL